MDFHTGVHTVGRPPALTIGFPKITVALASGCLTMSLPKGVNHNRFGWIKLRRWGQHQPTRDSRVLT